MKKSLSFGIITLFILSVLAPLSLGYNDRTYIENEPESTTSLIKGKPPLPPLVWTEKFFKTLYINTW